MLRLAAITTAPPAPLPVRITLTLRETRSAINAGIHSGAIVRPTILDRNVAALHKSRFAKPAAEPRHRLRPLRGRHTIEHADHRQRARPPATATRPPRRRTG
jgi:hypothetical protein